MDVYLPADFYRLRDDLPEWRDVAAASPEKRCAIEKAPAAFATQSRNDCADPLWQVL